MHLNRKIFFKTNHAPQYQTHKHYINLASPTQQVNMVVFFYPRPSPGQVLY